MSRPVSSLRGCRPAARRADPRRGSVLLFVLVLVVITSAAILTFGKRAAGEMAGEGYYVQRDRLRGEAYSALEATLAVLAEFREIDGGLFAPAQGWHDPLAYAGFVPTERREVTVEFFDENAKFALRQAEHEEAAMALLFTELGFDPKDIEVLTDSLLDWIDRDDTPRPFGAEFDTYAQEDPAHLPANRPPRTFEELAAVQGFGELMFTATGYPTAQFAAFRQRVSLYSNGPLNLNTASEDVLRLSGLFSDPQLSALATALDTVDGARGTAGGRFYRSVRELSDQVGALPTGSAVTVRSQVLSLVVTVREGRTEFRLRAVIQNDAPSGGANVNRNTQRASRTPRSAAAAGAGSNAVGSTVGAPTQVEYPFRFLELVEDPPPTTITQSVPTP